VVESTALETRQARKGLEGSNPSLSAQNNMSDQQTIDTYNKLALEYDNEVIEFWEHFPRTFISKFTESSGPNVLSVGSGTARDALLLKDAGKIVVCVDASEAMARISSERGFESHVADFNSLPFESGSFDAVWAFTSLLHIPKAEISTAFQEICRVLTPSGILVLSFIEGVTEEYKTSSGVQLPRLFSLYTKEDIDLLSKKHGCTCLHFEEFKPRSKKYLNFILRKN
jgi:ubiquinone/menaquinone biosynthesis C-methylase UbiE